MRNDETFSFYIFRQKQQNFLTTCGIFCLPLFLRRREKAFSTRNTCAALNSVNHEHMHTQLRIVIKFRDPLLRKSRFAWSRFNYIFFLFCHIDGDVKCVGDRKWKINHKWIEAMKITSECRFFWWFYCFLNNAFKPLL